MVCVEAGEDGSFITEVPAAVGTTLGRVRTHN